VIAQRIPVDISDVVIEMEPTVECEFIIVDEAGNSISDAMINMNPNRMLAPGFSSLVDFYCKSASTIGKKQDQHFDEIQRMFRENQKTSFYFRKTDAEGRAVIKNLPMKRNIGISIQHEKFELPIPDANPFQRSTHVDMSAGSTQMKIILQPIGTQVLGR